MWHVAYPRLVDGIASCRSLPSGLEDPTVFQAKHVGHNPSRSRRQEIQ